MFSKVGCMNRGCQLTFVRNNYIRSCLNKKQPFHTRSFGNGISSKFSPLQSQANAWVTVASVLTIGALSYYVSKNNSIELEAPGGTSASFSASKSLKACEVEKHNTQDSLWVVIGDDVWDVTEFCQVHVRKPGGAELLQSNGGKDITAVFNNFHNSKTVSTALTPEERIGSIDPVESHQLEKAADPAEQMYAERREELPSAYAVLNLDMFEEMAKEVFDEGKPWGFVHSWADDGHAFRANKASWLFVRFLPRVLIPVDKVDTSCSLIKNSPIFDIPLYISPTGRVRIFHPGGELSLVRAASESRVPFCISTGSSDDIDDVLDERDKIVKEGGFRPSIWLQLYVRSDRPESEKALRRVVEYVHLLDAPVVGNREADQAVHTKNTSGGGQDKPPTRFYDANLSWNDIPWIRRHAPSVPLLLKGIGCAADAKKAFDAGCEGVVLSNHGGRQLDFTPPALATLLDIREYYPDLIDNEKFEIYVDGGIRRGTDVIKALCLGAKGVGLGRPFLYANATHGGEGVNRVAEIVKQEIGLGMRLLGATSLQELRPEMIEILPGLRGEKPPGAEMGQNRS